MLRIFVKNGRQFNCLQKYLFHQTGRTFSDKKIIRRVPQNRNVSIPITLNKLKNGIKSIKDKIVPWDPNDDKIPWAEHTPIISSECDIVIIGGGVIGSSIAYWLKNRVYDKEMKVIVVEKDPMYTKASTVLSVGGLRQQFSLEENIEMSLFGAEFIRNINDYLGIDGEPPIDPYFHPYGYLMLASNTGAETLEKNSKLQNFLGAKNILLAPNKLKDMFPWLNTEDIALGCFGLEKEETPEGETRTIKFAICIVAAGAASGEVAKLAKIGTEEGLRYLALPVEPRKRYVYCFHCPEGPGLNTPLTVDNSGTYFRREGLAGTYICGRSPSESEEPSIKDLSVDENYFNDVIWPSLAHRVKAFEKLKLQSAWAGFYEYNTFDQNGIIGIHPYYNNVFFATGFSGHGIQQAPAVGRAIAELILDGRYITIDLGNLGFDRIVNGKPMFETNIV
ncbi:FAD-dependent oxidoreductase domain-containing protein 1 isoform X2 [Hylaeus volcanicus]|uniref:FAD-dependent oxidoreductase domain-containing protein 1 isoform X2 n=1 Tax=Hylaeus volcanicus TaxID=313075 RepID=UPI0023B81CA7|nr:FAD-dependent oxidoreductase domain-containing protein 1 isoform X2 [Hylaeus volcanicus]